MFKIRFKSVVILVGLVFFVQCTSTTKKVDNNVSERRVNFGKLIKINNSEVISNYSFIRLETTEESLIGTVNQIEIVNDKIYILDNYASQGLFVFSITGKFLAKLTHRGNGPGEFISPYSFYIDKNGYLLLYDMQLSRLLKYDSNSLKFIEEVKMPFRSAKSFYVLPSDDLYLYYGDKGNRDFKETNILIVSDKKGKVHKQFLKTTPSENIFHGSETDFYSFSGDSYFYPYFSNKIYLVKKDTVQCKYELLFGDNKMVDEELFLKYKNDRDFMKEIIMGDDNWIRLLYVYENDTNLVVKYYIKKDFYMGIYNKISQEVVNFKCSTVTDDIGIGGVFPLPKGRYGNRFIAQINYSDIHKDALKDEKLKAIVKVSSEDTNPILMIYSINSKLGRVSR
ncbi:hypothetical protein Palpr_1566 [Paludibacter propionicigenes WB4]|uniref:Uncharacterized protein n=1 Tax=Paludibacter propionicigenes (strain DSM 17365 / JCM 13257 / WB4) TaxID=694427 RepID=E4T4R7_PALPW|nr:6-bladed beta-propeller [Paludibacter propionicigenes]ADQ79711.1 hypothetical protein Palpr_1566 [Paludibacter propionicigenes WB4]